MGRGLGICKAKGMNNYEIRDEIKRRWRELWPADKGKGSTAGIICPLCGSGSGQHGSGVKLDAKSGGAFLHCFACGFNGDAITLLERETGGGYREAIEEGARRLSLSVDLNEKRPYSAGNRAGNAERGAAGINYRKEEKSGPDAPATDFSRFIEAARAGVKDEAARAYLEMARVLHCPIVCASSTARNNYTGAVDYSCFYGSGGIESAADCAAGLQLSVVYSQEYTGGKDKQAAIIARAAAENPRRVSFVGLKNRRGQMKKRVDFLFDPRHCTFTEEVVELSANGIEELCEFWK